MKVTALIVVFTLIGVSACANPSARRTTDINHIKAINKEAEFRNMDVIWINPPPVTRESSISVTIKADPDATEEVDPEEGSE